MSDFETKFLEENLPHFTQTGMLSDPSLNQLRDQIKKVMIPLLIKIFQFKLELSQSLSLPSRLQSQKNQRSSEEIIEQLKNLDHDLKILFLWCQSSRSQIQKALQLPEEEQKSGVTTLFSETNSSIDKSLSETIQATDSYFQLQSPPHKRESDVR